MTMLPNKMKKREDEFEANRDDRTGRTIAHFILGLVIRISGSAHPCIAL
jgi:hypothetical protein